MAAAIQFANATAEAKQLRKEAGRWLQSQRKQAGLSQIQLAEQLGLKYYTFVSQVESGIGRLPIEMQEAWAEALSLEPRDFAQRLLAWYEPALYRLLFGDDLAQARASA